MFYKFSWIIFEGLCDINLKGTVYLHSFVLNLVLFFCGINIVNNLKLVAGFTFISFSLRLARNNVYPEGHPKFAQRVYAITDDQSNRSLARSEFFSLFNIESASFPYRLSSCSGLTSTSGRRAIGFVIKSIDGSAQLQLPTLIECDEIPNLRSEIPTPEVASLYPYLHDISSQILSIDNNAHMLILIGLDLPEAHHVLDQRIGDRGTDPMLNAYRWVGLLLVKLAGIKSISETL